MAATHRCIGRPARYQRVRMHVIQQQFLSKLALRPRSITIRPGRASRRVPCRRRCSHRLATDDHELADVDRAWSPAILATKSTNSRCHFFFLRRHWRPGHPVFRTPSCIAFGAISSKDRHTPGATGVFWFLLECQNA